MNRLPRVHFPVTPGCKVDELRIDGVCKVPPFQGPLPLLPLMPPNAIPPGGYRCLNAGGLFACGGDSPYFDFCHQDRAGFPDAVCVIVPTSVFFAHQPPPTYEACPGVMVTVLFTMLVSVVCR